MNCAKRSLVVVNLIANIDASQFKVGNSSVSRVELNTSLTVVGLLL